MKRVLIGGLLFSRVLFGDCTEAEKIFSDSRDETNIKQKIALIKKAKKICGLPQIEIEMERLKIDYLINKNHLKGLELRLNKLKSKIDSKDGLPYEFRFNSKRQTMKLFKRLYTKQQEMGTKKSFTTHGATIKNLDDKLKKLGEVFDKNDVKSLDNIGGMYKSNLKFLKDSSTINDLEEAKELKSKMKEIIALHPEALFSVTGYASSEGSSDYNKKLSQKRAKSFVVFVGSNRKNIKSFYKGENFLVCYDELIPEHDENGENRCINGENKEASRRVTVRRVR